MKLQIIDNHDDPFAMYSHVISKSNKCTVNQLFFRGDFISLFISNKLVCDD